VSRGVARDVAYAGLNAPNQAAYVPTVSILPALYSENAGLSLVVLGSMLVFLRVLDSVIDPAIGYLSDRTRSPFGRRKPWMAVGAVLASCGLLVAFRVSPSTSYFDIALGYLLLVVGWSMVEIPHLALINELTEDYTRRSRLSTYRYIAGLAGTGMFLAIPLVGGFATTAMTPQVTEIGAWLMIALYALTLPVILAWLPRGSVEDAAHAPSFRAVLKSFSGNTPFWMFIAIRACGGLGSGIVSGLFFFYLGAYLHIADKYSHIMLAVYVVSVVGALIWLRITLNLDKHRIIAACALATAACNVAMWLIVPGEWAFPAMFGVFAVTAFAVAGMEGAVNSLNADLVDYGELKTGIDHAGNFFAFAAFVYKCGIAFGGGLGLVIAGLFGFSAKGPNDANAMWGFFLALVWIPFALNVACGVLAWRFPLTRRRQIAIRHRLDRRAARLARQAA
jgi:Na+/melibiose symporter-like transporter